MTRLPEIAALAPAERARALLSGAKAELNGRLWRAALGGAGLGQDGDPHRFYVPPSDGLEALLRQAIVESPHGSAHPPSPTTMIAPGATSPVAFAPLAVANTRYAGALNSASARTGIPATALSAIIGAEAARGTDGAWNPLSRNPRSSAAGLGQFLSDTWLGLARQNGSWLNRYARERGLIDAAGHIASGARSTLLALRYDPQAAIESVADYARANVMRLRQAGVAVDESAVALTRAAYIGHHLGPGDAQRFYKGELTAIRARALLSAQIGAEKAELRIAQAGDAAKAHRGWLLDYIARNIG